VPLRSLTTAKETDNLHCGLLRGLNSSELLVQLGAKSPSHAKGFAAEISGEGKGKYKKAKGDKPRAKEGAARRLLGRLWGKSEDGGDVAGRPASQLQGSMLSQLGRRARALLGIGGPRRH
jgi:hypothetical protein